MHHRVLIAPSVLIALVFGAVVFGAGAARASLQEVYIPVAQSFTTETFQGGEVAGSTFHAINTITFNSLGFIDVQANPPSFQFLNNPDGLLGSYQVGIWLNSTQALLASATVTPSSPLGAIPSQFRYAPIPPTTIPAGQDFTIGALLPANSQDAWLINDTPTDMTGISGAGLGFTLPGTTLSFPTQGANAPYAVANASTATVPEPAATAGIVASLVCLAALPRRKRPLGWFEIE